MGFITDIDPPLMEWLSRPGATKRAEAIFRAECLKFLGNYTDRMEVLQLLQNPPSNDMLVEKIKELLPILQQQKRSFGDLVEISLRFLRAGELEQPDGRFKAWRVALLDPPTRQREEGGQGILTYAKGIHLPEEAVRRFTSVWNQPEALLALEMAFQGLLLSSRDWIEDRVARGLASEQSPRWGTERVFKPEQFVWGELHQDAKGNRWYPLTLRGALLTNRIVGPPVRPFDKLNNVELEKLIAWWETTDLAEEAAVDLPPHRKKQWYRGLNAKKQENILHHWRCQ